MIRRLLIVAVLIVALAAIGTYWFFSGDGVRVALERQATAWLGQPVRIGRATVAFIPRVGIRLADVTVGEPARLTLSRVDLSTGIRPLLSRRIEDGELIVSGSRIEMPLPFSLPVHPAATPTATGSAAAAAGSGGLEVVSIRAITLRDVVMASRGRAMTLSADSAFTGDELTISLLTARSGDTMLSASGTVKLTPRPTATIEATANQLDFDDLLALFAAFTANTSSAPATTRTHITARLTAPRARLAGVALSRFDASVLADGSEVRIEPLKFDVFGGHHDGWLDATFGEMLNVRVGVGVANIDVADLAALGGVANTITGRLYGSGRFGARGRDMAEVLAAARGVGEVMLSDGTIRNLDVIRTVVLYFGRPAEDAPPTGGERYDSIGATFALADQVVRSDDLALRSPDFDVFARGTLALPTKAIDARAELVLSERLSAQAGRDLYRFTRSGNRVVLPAIISGTLAQPGVRINAEAAVRRGLQNEIERRLEDLLERVTPRLP